jgi:hypothetical protein
MPRTMTCARKQTKSVDYGNHMVISERPSFLPQLCVDGGIVRARFHRHAALGRAISMTILQPAPRQPAPGGHEPLWPAPARRGRQAG